MNFLGYEAALIFIIDFVCLWLHLRHSTEETDENLQYHLRAKINRSMKVLQ